MFGRDDFPGKASLILFLCGLLLLGLDWYGVRFSPRWFSPRWFYGAYFVGAGLELAAAAFGWAGRDSGKARVGLALSLLSLLLFVGFCCGVLGSAGMGGTGVHG
jgi:hypothetical protein